jgi:murein DD-endopeptidase MepM/ murein hydrolase activator NlpD
VIKYKNFKQFTNVFLFLASFLLFFFNVGFASAETTPYRSAGWVGTDGNLPYTNLDNCQESDGKYCSRASSQSGGSLYFGSFGRLEDFGIPINSEIDGVHIRITGKNTRNQTVFFDDVYNSNRLSSSCLKNTNKSQVNLGSSGSVVIVSFFQKDLNPGCLTANKVNFHDLTFRLSHYILNTAWSADIDNFEIAFDYTPPAITPTPVEFPENQKGTVWEIGPDISNLKRVDGLSDVVSVVAGYDHVLALKNDGTVWAWGRNDAGQLGIGTFGDNYETPVQVLGEKGEGYLGDVKQIAAGDGYSMALREDNTVWVWGNNSDGLRGVGFGVNDSASKLLYPTQIKSGFFNNIVKIAAGRSHTLVLNSDGRLVGWGRNNKGEVGSSCRNCGAIRGPVRIDAISDVVDIAAGREHSLAVEKDGTLWGWGRTSEYQLAKNATINSPSGFGEWHTPTKIIELDNIKQVYSYLTNNLAVNEDGEIFEWGGNIYLGLPRRVNGIMSPKITSIGFPSYSPGVNGHAIKPDGTLWQMNINEIPARQVPVLRNVSDVASGYLTPALAVVNGSGDVLGDSDVAPFLRLPWDYEGKEKEFNDVALQINSYFDHTFPFLSTSHPEPATASANTTSFRNKDEPSGYSSHDGYDWGSAAFVDDGDDVLAAAAGTASAILAKDSSGAGNVIKIDHGNGYQTWYEHLYEDGMIVKPGEAKKVEKGDVIGKVGHTGNCWVYGSKGEKIENTPACAHIHFSVLQDKNNDKDFSNNKIDGFTDPFGWMPYTEPEEREDDPWEIYKFMHHGIEKTGNKSNYLWEEEIDNLVKIVSDEGEAVKVGDYAIDIPADEELDGAKLNAHLEPATDVSITLPAIGPGLSITLKDTNGDFLTKLNNPIKITVGLADFPLQKYKKETLQFYSSNDLSVWIKEPSVFDPLTQTLSVEIDHLTHFVIAGERADSVAPTTVISLIGEGTGDNVFSSDVIVNLITEDNEGGSGVKKTYFKIGEEDWTEYIAPLNLGEQGKYVLEYYSIDKDNNNEDPGKTEFLIDKTAPVSALSIGGTEGENGWYVSNPTVTLSAEDNLSGVERLEYSLNGGESFELYETPFEISTEGVNGLLYRAVDKAGNTEEAKEEEIKLDKTPPQSKVYISGSRGQENWYRSSVSLELSGSDEVSGYGGSFYSLDGGESFSEYTETIFFVDEETYEVAYYSVDIAGNKETEKVLVFNIDKTAPVVTLSVDPDMLWPPNGKMVSVRIGGSVTEENLFATVFGASDEYGEVEPAVSNFGQTIKLQARRNGNDPDGRVYAVRAVSEDLAGNEGSSEAKIVVPHDKRN